MLQRVQSVILLLALAITLPQAGAAWAWCLHAQRAFAPGEDCGVSVLRDSQAGCDCHQKEHQGGCMVEAGKLLPDAITTQAAAIPSIGLAGILVQGALVYESPAFCFPPLAPWVLRGPPPRGCPLFRKWSVVRC